MVCPINIWQSCILAVSIDGIIIDMSEISLISPPSLPKKEITWPNPSPIVLIAFITFLDFPEVENYINMSPLLNEDLISLENISSYE